MSNSEIEKLTEKKKGKITTIIAIVLLVAAAASSVLLFMMCERESPLINVKNDIARFGAGQEINFEISDLKSGIRSIDIQLTQGEKRADLYERRFARQGYFSKSGPNQLAETVSVNTASLGFNDGAAELLFTVRDYSFWHWTAGNIASEKFPVIIDTKAPKLSIIESPRYISPGGSGVIIYLADEPLARHGVVVNNMFHPGFPLSDANDGKFIAYIGLPYDTEKLEKVLVIATDQAGNEGTAAFGMVLKKASWRNDRINISDSFLSQKIPEFSQNYPKLTGSPLEQYLQINSQIRKENNDKIMQVCSQPNPKKLWRGKFAGMSRGSRKAGFADHRSYFYNDREIDRQVHLGIDLASTAHVEIKAANHGAVVFADYLGIYGNTVILDHGQGLFSLYAHLSQIEVEPGNTVEQNGRLGLSGSSGMAGGDHLHFSMLVNGVFVTPLEWWDELWLKVNLRDQL